MTKYYVAVPTVEWEVHIVVAADTDDAIEVADGAECEAHEEYIDTLYCTHDTLPPEFGGWADPEMFVVKEVADA